MSNEEFDKVLDEQLSSLYQQRKAQINVPEVNIAKHQGVDKKAFSFSRLTSVPLAAGGASFAIFAVITHFATKTPNSTYVVRTSPPISVEKLPPVSKQSSKKETYAVAVPPLPPQPKTISKPINTVKVDRNESQVSKGITLPQNYIQGLDVPPIKEPELALKPVFKVLPKYFIDAKDKSFSGEVKLSYQINKNGSTSNIQVISSNVDRELKKSAKKALAQWQYKAAENYHGVYEVIFEFKQ